MCQNLLFLPCYSFEVRDLSGLVYWLNLSFFFFTVGANFLIMFGWKFLWSGIPLTAVLRSFCLSYKQGILFFTSAVLPQLSPEMVPDTPLSPNTVDLEIVVSIHRQLRKGIGDQSSAERWAWAPRLQPGYLYGSDKWLPHVRRPLTEVLVTAHCKNRIKQVFKSLENQVKDKNSQWLDSDHRTNATRLRLASREDMTCHREYRWCASARQQRSPGIWHYLSCWDTSIKLFGHLLGDENPLSPSKVSMLSWLLTITSAKFAFIKGLAGSLP